MSRSSLSARVRGKLRADLRPAGVTLARKSSFSERLLPLRAVPVVHEETGEQSVPWRTSAEALASMLNSATKGSSSVEVVVSSHFIRYAMVPWSDNLVRDAERLAFARLAFREVYGALVDSWEICLDEQPAGQPAVASAIDRDLLSAIRAAVSNAGAGLDGVVPALADCINRHRRAFKGREFCLASVEAGRLTFAFRGRAGWRAVRSRRVDGALDELLPTLLKQEASAAGVQEGGILYLCAPNVREFAGTPVPGWKLVLLADAAPPPAPMVEPALVSMES